MAEPGTGSAPAARVVIGVVGAASLTVEGLRQTLAAAGVGDVVPMADVDAAADTIPPVLLVYVAAVRELDRVRCLTDSRPEVAVVAVVPSPLWCRMALDAGVRSVLGAGMGSCAYSRVLQSCLDGEPLLPTELALSALRVQQCPDPSREELRVLEELARGEPVRAVAVRLGYSERHMHRRLTALYRKLTAENRDEAIASARTLGWIRGC